MNQTSHDATVATTDERIDINDLMTPEAIAKANPALPRKSILWLIRSRDNNGLMAAGAVVQMGRRLLIVRSRFERWLAQRAEEMAELGREG